MKKIKTLLLILNITILLYSQDYQWTNTFGGPANQYGNNIIADNSNNFYVVGSLFDSAYLNPNIPDEFTYTTGAMAMFIQKYDADANFLWAKAIHTANSIYCTSMDIDADGNIYMVGNYKGQTDFDPDTTEVFYNTIGSAWGNIFFLKLDTAGVFQWVKVIGNIEQESLNSITITPSQDIYITGSFEGEVDFNPKPGITDYHDSGSSVFSNGSVSKYDTAGTYKWTKSFGFRPDVVSEMVNYYSDSELLLVGTFSDSIDLDLGPGTDIHYTGQMSLQDIFLMKIDSEGNSKWGKAIHTRLYIDPANLVIDSLGSTYMIGRFYDTADFDPGPVEELRISYATYEDDLFVLKLDSSGNFNWVNTYTGNSMDKRAGNLIMDSCYLFFRGAFTDSIDFDPGPGTDKYFAEEETGFVQKLDTSGVVEWTRFLDANINSISIDNLHNLYLTGSFNETVDFNPGSGVDEYTATGSEDDVFISKWGSGSVDCDIDVSVTQNGSVLTANESEAEYQWLDCNNSFSPVNGATSQSFEPSGSGSYAVEITKDICVDTSTCYAVTVTRIVLNTFGENIIMYPNPTEGQITIQLSKQYKSISLTLKNIIGQTLENTTVNHTNKMDFIIHEPKGVFFIELETDNGEKAVLKIVKE